MGTRFIESNINTSSSSCLSSDSDTDINGTSDREIILTEEERNVLASIPCDEDEEDQQLPEPINLNSSENDVENSNEKDVSEENISTDSEEDIDNSDNESIVINFENDEHKERYVIQNLREWATSGGIVSMTKIDNLLIKLRPVFRNLPKSYKTLLKTPRAIRITPCYNGGQMWYRGIKNNLDAFILEEYLQMKVKIEIDVNMDGLPLFRSSKKKFWPILGCLVGAKNEPFVIAIYFGKSNPNNVEEFLEDFVTEAEYLINNGYTRYGRNYGFIIRHYILDAPARELVKCYIGHGGYASCEKCTICGENGLIIDRLMLILMLL